jgi:hypothetical protein
MARTKPTIIELDLGKLEELLQRIDAQELRAEDGATSRVALGGEPPRAPTDPDLHA